MKRLIKRADIHEQTEINGKEVIIYNSPAANEMIETVQKSSNNSIKGVLTDSDIYVWPFEFDSMQVKSYIRDNFDMGYQFQTNGMGYIKFFRNSPINEEEIRMVLISYYSYLMNIVDTQNADLEIINYVSGENQSDNAYITKFNDFINR